MSNIKVLVRFRRPENSLPFTKITKNEVFVESNGVRYNFDRVFVKESNKSIYEYLRKGISCGNDLERAKIGNTDELADSTSLSNALTIMCYGSTGSGKTFTMLGNKHEKGIFQLIRDSYDIVEFKCFELYNERVILRTENVRDVGSFEGMLVRKRTALNEESSRSHTIMEMVVKQNRAVHEKHTDELFKIILIDLAGSEDNRKTGNTPQLNPSLMKESSTINKSLFVLRNVITAIYKKRKSVPFRESVLTKYLKEYFRGRVVLLATVVDDCDMMGEGISTLNFASMSKRIVWKAKMEHSQRCNEVVERLYRGKSSNGKERPVLDEKINFEDKGMRRPVRRVEKTKTRIKKDESDLKKKKTSGEKDGRGLNINSNGTNTKIGNGENIFITNGAFHNISCDIEGNSRGMKDDKTKNVLKDDADHVNENRMSDVFTTFSSNDMIIHSFDCKEEENDKLVSKKVFDAILKRALQFEERGYKRKALENYQMLLEMTEENKNGAVAASGDNSGQINSVIKNIIGDSFERDHSDSGKTVVDDKRKNDVGVLINRIKTKIASLTTARTKPSMITKKELLKLLNKADFLSLKKIKNIGDKRAMKIIEYLKFKRIDKTEDLCKIFSKRVVNSIMKNVKE
ncbi:Kinesin-like protein [Trachipleistophora hominis]|uniref:Kinesin-like protein n=1 Tax=Trachipleistophora hominis TaxID=72359 RepID=L7JSP7_TRAHO|nr:Kinesin-like protein [Trachipleistophora hominis]